MPRCFPMSLATQWELEQQKKYIPTKTHSQKLKQNFLAIYIPSSELTYTLAVNGTFESMMFLFPKVGIC